jgi:hypothetical protein
MLLTTLILGLVLGGTYALLALGLTLQYGIARIMNLAYGEFTLVSAFVLVTLYQALGVPPLVALLAIAPAGYAAGWLVYALMMRPLLRGFRPARGRFDPRHLRPAVPDPGGAAGKLRRQFHLDLLPGPRGEHARRAGGA